MPAHITLLYPFKPPNEFGATVLADLRQCFAGFAAFHFSLATIRRFPGVLYLAPEPEAPFRRLTLAIWDRYPGTPPYGGKHADVVPHLSVAQLADEQRLGQVDRDFRCKARGEMPIAATATEVALMDTRPGRWQVRATLRLGDAGGPGARNHLFTLSMDTRGLG